MMDQEKLDFLQDKAKEARYLAIKALGNFGVGHVGGSMSVIEVMVALYYSEMNVDPKNPKWDDRDRLVVSKGHSGPALYSVLAMKGFFDRKELDTLNQPGTNLPSHCDMKRTIGIDMSTGSLGQGISAAVGMAMAAKLDKKAIKVYTIIGDGESQEGQVWEAAMLAHSRKLDNLIAFTDYNKLQLDSYTDDINTLEPLTDKWASFGWFVQSIDGHNFTAIIEAIQKAKAVVGQPSMIILNTVKGKGFSFCEGVVRSHNMVVTPEILKKALEELDYCGQGA
jgi:transketolase